MSNEIKQLLPGWKIERKVGGPFKTIHVVSPDNYVAVLNGMENNPGSVLYKLAEALLESEQPVPTFDPTLVMPPPEVVKAAQVVEQYFKSVNKERWMFMGLQSRGDIQITEADARMLVNFLENPPPRNEAFTKAMARHAEKLEAGYCSEGDRCVCGGDLPQIQQGCGNWVSGVKR